jgi:hypothetical protein
MDERHGINIDSQGKSTRDRRTKSKNAKARALQFYDSNSHNKSQGNEYNEIQSKLSEKADTQNGLAAVLSKQRMYPKTPQCN